MHTYKNIILRDVKQLRPTSNCTLHLPEDYETLQKSKWYAAYNVHFLMEFDDGVKWLIRVRQDRGHRIPHEVREADIKSEVATLQRLRSGGISVPEAWLSRYLDGCNNGMPTISPFPFDYFFYTFLQGRPRPIRKTPFYPMRLPEEDIKKYIEAYALHQIKMSHLVLPLNQIGCLQMNKSGEVVGPIITRGTFQKPEPPYLLGPFSTQKECYLSHIDTTLDYILMGAVGESGPIDSYLWHLEMRELVEHSKILASPITEVYIKHDDEKGDQLLWDDDGKICGVLDWQWAYITTKAEAFAAPPLLYFTKASTFSPKIGFREPFEPDLPSDFQPPLDDVDWRVYMMERYKDNKGLQELMKILDWTIEKATEEAFQWHREKDENKSQEHAEHGRNEEDNGLISERDEERAKVDQRADDTTDEERAGVRISP
ncbi:hypothetical protein V865_003516 [Kwoniella europaea PYCC6329]|uniref:Aminoglycoside phosphotransferase domain-containing protein n=1 Tax=Kwoniella europaea PYCC6329 TaxID=1423913 RepID=A0AAX4KHB0_9TREE